AMDGGADSAASLAGIVDPSGTVSAFRPRTPPKWILPTALAHRASVTKAIGGWKHRRDIPDSYPENELVERIRDHGYRFVRDERLTAIKFSAAARKNVYREKPCHEQAEWFAKIGSDRALEAKILASWLMHGDPAYEVPYSQLAATFSSETCRRTRRRIMSLVLTNRRPPPSIEEM